MPKPADNYLAGTSGDDSLNISAETADYTVDGLAGNDTIRGGHGHDSLYGGRGNDLIYAGVEDLVINGGAGADTVSFLYATAAVRVELSDGAVGLQPGIPTPRILSGIENLIGSDYGDLLAGNRGVNEIDGGAGDDKLQPSGIGDFLTGGDGADKFYVFAATATVTITDFHFNEGDRIVGDTVISDWVYNSSDDAWIGTCIQAGRDLQVIVLGADTTPSADWFAPF